MIPYNVLTSTRYGTMLCNRNDVYVGGSLLTYGEFSELELDLLRFYAPPESVVLDVGANIGALTVALAQWVGPRGAVVAFEPQRLVYQTLCANLALNSLTNVRAFAYAVGHPESGAMIRIPLTNPWHRNNFGGVELSAEAIGEATAVMALDACGLPPCSLLKADVEGMEAEVLRGGRSYIAQHRPVLYLEADRPAKRPELLELLDELGYDAYAHHPPLYNPDNWRGDPTNCFGEIVSVNVLGLPRGKGFEPPPLERAEA